MVFITAVHLEGGRAHEDIAKVAWRNSSNGNTGESTREAIVAFINEKGAGSVKVADRVGSVNVGVYEEKWLRTYADKRWTDNLLALPRF